MNIAALYDIVEKGILKMGVEPETARTQNPGHWDFIRGSASISVGMIQNDRFPNGYFYVTSVLMSELDVVASKKELFYQTLLETNTKLVNMQLAVSDDLVLLISNRDAVGLDDIEVAIAINELSFYADELDDQLKNRFASL
jgi:hypothetical protein